MFTVIASYSWSLFNYHVFPSKYVTSAIMLRYVCENQVVFEHREILARPPLHEISRLPFAPCGKYEKSAHESKANVLWHEWHKMTVEIVKSNKELAHWENLRCRYC